ncbi:MAG TPA: hypothetical protein VNT51_05500 [Miltoncostaeaceae bacterium]|nr:hypothetical protein [Miltoncostaeaceae bacterium]
MRSPAAPRPRVLLATAALAAVAAVGAAVDVPIAPAASADASACGQSFAQHFLPWKDSAYYTLADGGDAETGAVGWTLAGAEPVAGGSPHRGGVSADTSFRIAPGGSITTPPICVTDAHRTMRFFSRVASGTAKDSLRVELIVSDAGKKEVREMAKLSPGTSWHPTKVVSLDTSLFGVDPSSPTAEVHLRIRSVTATVQVDDVFVDPRLR